MLQTHRRAALLHNLWQNSAPALMNLKGRKKDMFTWGLTLSERRIATVEHSQLCVLTTLLMSKPCAGGKLTEAIH